MCVFPFGSAFGSGMKSVLGHSGAVYILIEEPVHGVVAVQVHGPDHMFFNEGNTNAIGNDDDIVEMRRFRSLYGGSREAIPNRARRT